MLTAFFTILSAAVTLVVLTASRQPLWALAYTSRFYQSRLLQKIEQPELLALFRAIILYSSLTSFVAVWRQSFLLAARLS
jgi:hypothetical protein